MFATNYITIIVTLHYLIMGIWKIQYIHVTLINFRTHHYFFHLHTDTDHLLVLHCQTSLHNADPSPHTYTHTHTCTHKHVHLYTAGQTRCHIILLSLTSFIRVYNVLNMCFYQNDKGGHSSSYRPAKATLKRMTTEMCYCIVLVYR